MIANPDARDHSQEDTKENAREQWDGTPKMRRSAKPFEDINFPVERQEDMRWIVDHYCAPGHSAGACSGSFCRRLKCVQFASLPHASTGPAAGTLPRNLCHRRLFRSGARISQRETDESSAVKRWPTSHSAQIGSAPQAPPAAQSHIGSRSRTKHNPPSAARPSLCPSGV